MTILGFGQVSIVSGAEPKKKAEEDSHFDEDSDSRVEELVGNRYDFKNDRVSKGDFHAESAGAEYNVIALNQTFHRIREAGVEEVSRSDKESRFQKRASMAQVACNCGLHEGESVLFNMIREEDKEAFADEVPIFKRT